MTVIALIVVVTGDNVVVSVLAGRVKVTGDGVTVTVIADAVTVTVGMMVVVARTVVASLSTELEAVMVAVVVTVTGVGVAVTVDVTTLGPPKRLKPPSSVTVTVLAEVTNLVSVAQAPLCDNDDLLVDDVVSAAS